MIEQQQCVSILRREDETAQLREEIMKRVELQDPLFLAALTASVAVLSLAVSLSPLIASFLPIVLLALAMRINSHSRRIAQLGFSLRYVYRSPYEIQRRAIFDGVALSEVEQAVLREQGLLITPTMIREAKKISPALPGQKSLERWILFCGFDVIALMILVTRTYQNIDALAVGAWFVAGLATVTSVFVLRHRRVRRALDEDGQVNESAS